MLFPQKPNDKGEMTMVEIKEPFKARLEKALEYRKMKPVELAKKTNISEAKISQYRSGYSKPKNQRLVLIANALKVDPSWLMGVDVPMIKDAKPVYNVAAGQGRITDGYPTEAYDLNPKDDEFLHRVYGESMSPTIEDQDIVVISMQSVLDYDGQMALVKINGEEATVKRVEIKDNGILLVGDNVRVFTPKFYTKEEVEQLPVRIEGVVVRIIRDVR